MYPTRKSLHKETIESYSKTATGILLMIGLIFVVLIFGCWGVATTNGVADGTQSAGQAANEEMPYAQSTSESEISEEKSSEIKVSEDAAPEDENSEILISDFESLEVAGGLGPSDVLVAESCTVEGLDVEAGSISLYDANFPNTLPVCITNDTLAEYYVSILTYGGYVPIDGQITLTQCKTGKGGVIDITWTRQPWLRLWKAEFSVAEPIVLDSNHMPNVCIPGCEVIDGPDNLGKWVWGSVCTTWTGCEELYQQFYVGGCIPCLDVEPGKICLYDTNIPDTLPITISNDWLADKYITLCVYGGYEPIDGMIDIFQNKEYYRKGQIEITWTEVSTNCPCGAVLWNATFKVFDPIYGKTSIVLESNHLPDINIPGWTWIYGPDNLDKWVSASILTTWQGCTEADQQFQIIPAHKSFVPESPTLDERYIAIASSNVAVRIAFWQAKLVLLAISPFII